MPGRAHGPAGRCGGQGVAPGCCIAWRAGGSLARSLARGKWNLQDRGVKEGRKRGMRKTETLF